MLYFLASELAKNLEFELPKQVKIVVLSDNDGKPLTAEELVDCRKRAEELKLVLPSNG